MLKLKHRKKKIMGVNSFKCETRGVSLVQEAIEVLGFAVLKVITLGEILTFFVHWNCE
jgi:hypothetical protein